MNRQKICKGVLIRKYAYLAGSIDENLALING